MEFVRGGNRGGRLGFGFELPEDPELADSTRRGGGGR